jgi:DNA gyrase inhibitor GyrI
MKQENLQNVRIAYMRSVGEYGSKNHELMETFKAFLSENDLFDENTVILGIALDNPAQIPAEKCRYDIGLVLNGKTINGLETRPIDDGDYAVFEVEHTAEGVQRFWNDTPGLAEKLAVDFEKPIIDRYAMKKIKDHLCEFLLPLSGVNKRPELTRGLSSQRFREYYYLKSELMEFCRKEQLSTSGSKAELANRVETFLQTGKRNAAEKPIANKASVRSEMSLTSVIEENFRCSERHRDFFKSVIGSSFKFNVEFQTWLKNNAGKTYADAVSACKEITKKKKTTTTEIGGQFEYNAYIRTFFEANKGRTLAQAIVCWKHKKSLPGHNRYEPSDLEALGLVRRSEP